VYFQRGIDTFCYLEHIEIQWLYFKVGQRLYFGNGRLKTKRDPAFLGYEETFEKRPFLSFRA